MSQVHAFIMHKAQIYMYVPAVYPIKSGVTCKNAKQWSLLRDTCTALYMSEWRLKDAYANNP